MIVMLLSLGLSPALAVDIAFERDQRLPLVHLDVAVRAGFAADPEGRSGLTNLLGEALLRGTLSRSKEQIDRELDAVGAEISVETRAEAMIFRGSTLASSLERFLSLFEDILTRPRFQDAEIRKLKSELAAGILEEMGDDDSLAQRAFNLFLFGRHPYGNPVLGRTKDIEAATPEAIRAHYDLLIRDRRLVVVGAGDADPERIRAWAGSLANSRHSGKELQPLEPARDALARRLLIVDKPERTQTQIYLGTIGTRMTAPEYFALYLGNYAFGGGSFQSRLMREVRVKRGWSYGAGSYFRHGTEPRSWAVHLFPAEKDTAPALELVLRMIAELRQAGITQEELERSKRAIVNGAGFAYDTPRKRIENTILEKTIALPDGFIQGLAAEVEKLTLGQVNAALREFLKPDRLAITVVGTADRLKEPLARVAGLPANLIEVRSYREE